MAEKKKVTFYLGTGRRKSAVARVRVTEGKGQVLINERPLPEYFSEEKDRAAVMGPLLITEQANRLDVMVRVQGGGITGQAGAISQGVARAVKTMFSPKGEQRVIVRNHVTMVKGYKAQTKDSGAIASAPKPAAPKPLANADGTPVMVAPEDPAAGMIKKLRDSGYLTRDSRMKERKKYGLRGARRGTQFSKR
jgi:small subunit ribosomal protein S9